MKVYVVLADLGEDRQVIGVSRNLRAAKVLIADTMSDDHVKWEAWKDFVGGCYRAGSNWNRQEIQEWDVV